MYDAEFFESFTSDLNYKINKYFLNFILNNLKIILYQARDGQMRKKDEN